MHACMCTYIYTYIYTYYMHDMVSYYVILYYSIVHNKQVYEDPGVHRVHAVAAALRALNA